MHVAMCWKACLCRRFYQDHQLTEMEGKLWSYSPGNSFIPFDAHFASSPRIQSGDMLVEIAGQPMVGGTLPNATQITQAFCREHQVSV